MKYFAVVLVFSICVHLGFSSAYAPKGHCYVKSQKCCFKYTKCSEKTHTKPDTYNCDFRVCKPHCTNTCHKVKIVFPKKHCFTKSTPLKKCSRASGYGGWGLYQKPSCKVVHYKKLVCTKVYKTTYKTKCKKVCTEKCRTVRADCTKTKTFKSNVFCPKLHCAPGTVSGSSATPPTVTGDARLVSTLPSKRRIIGGNTDDGASVGTSHGGSLGAGKFAGKAKSNYR